MRWKIYFYLPPVFHLFTLRQTGNRITADWWFLVSKPVNSLENFRVCSLATASLMPLKEEFAGSKLHQ